MAEPETERRWWMMGLAKALSGVVLGWILSMLVFVGLSLQVGWVRELEARGIGLSMRMAIAFYGPISERYRTAGKPGVTPILFLDIDEAACEKLARSPSRCRTEGVSDPALLTSLGQALRESKAKAVVLDMRLPVGGDQAEADAIAAAWADGAGPPVYAALPAVPTAQGSLRLDWAAVASYRRGRMQLFPAVGGALDESPGVLGRVPREVKLVPSGAIDGPQRLPSLAVAVAQQSGIARTATNAKQGGYSGVYLTLPSLVAPRAESLAGDYIGDYERRSLSDMIAGCEGCPGGLRTGDWSGWIVIVGSSAAAAQDIHETAIGRMPGAEFMANAIRAEELGAYSTGNAEPGLADKIFGTFPAVGLSALSWLAICWLWRSDGKLPAWRRVIYSLLTYAAALSAALLLNVHQTMSDMIGGPTRTGPTDLLFPTLAIFLEGLIDGFSHVTHAVEATVLRALMRFVRKKPEEAAPEES